jgi:hypothetical protein
MSAVSAAQVALDRRAAVAALAGAMLGSLPLLWLIREALDEYYDRLDGRRRWQTAALLRPVHLLDFGGHGFLLAANNGSRIVEECDANASVVRSHEVPDAALVLHEAVRHDPVAAENLIATIERATKAASL